MQDPPSWTGVAGMTTCAAQGDWRWEPLGACPIKGRQTPVHAYRLVETGFLPSG